MVIWNSVERRTEWLFILALFTPQSRRCFLASRHPRFDDAFSRPGIAVSARPPPSRRCFPPYRRCVPRVPGTKFSDLRRSPSRRGFPDSTMLSAVSTMRSARRAIKRARPCRWKYHCLSYHLKRGGNYSVRSVVQWTQSSIIVSANLVGWRCLTILKLQFVNDYKCTIFWSHNKYLLKLSL